MHFFAIGLRSRFRRVDRREGIIISGAAGYGEFSPFADYSPAECVPWLKAAIEAADLGFPEPHRPHVPVNAIVPAVDSQRARELVAASSCATFKVKVADPGQALDKDIARLEAIRETAGDEAKIRIDVNGAWALQEALKYLPVLDEAAGGLEYVEQPVASVADMATLRGETDVLIAADESIRRADDPFLVREAEAADIAVLKVQPLGGVRACLDIARQIELPVVVSSAVETSVGLAAGVALAAALPELPYACGLATGRLLMGDVVKEPLIDDRGMLPVKAVELDEAALAACAADSGAEDQWKARLTAVREAMHG